MADGKYYWLKLKRDFFKRHDVRLLESEENGDKYLLFYLKLMLESIDHNGELRYSEKKPYTLKDLAVITNTNYELVERGVEILQEMDLLTITEDKTFCICKVKEMIGSASDSDSAKRQKRYRDKQKEKPEKKKTEKNKSDYESEFEEVWGMYPRKQGKSNALRSFSKARKDGTSKEDILQGLKKYNAYIERNKVDEQYIKMGSTWFNQKCWEDNYDDNGRSKGTKGAKKQAEPNEEDADWFFN